MRVLLIDDMRDILMVHDWRKNGHFEIGLSARNFDEGIKALKEDGPWDILYLDHDLGDPSPYKTGYDIMCFLEANPEFLPDSIQLVTSNPVGRQKMQVVIDKLYKEEK